MNKNEKKEEKTRINMRLIVNCVFPMEMKKTMVKKQDQWSWLSHGNDRKRGEQYTYVNGRYGRTGRLTVVFLGEQTTDRTRQNKKTRKTAYPMFKHKNQPTSLMDKNDFVRRFFF